jgi:hypothetical protein
VKEMQSTDLREKIKRSLPLLSPHDLMKVAALIDELEPQKATGSAVSGRDAWVDRLRQNRAKLSVNGTQQTVIELRQEERF